MRIVVFRSWLVGVLKDRDPFGGEGMAPDFPIRGLHPWNIHGAVRFDPFEYPSGGESSNVVMWWVPCRRSNPSRRGYSYSAPWRRETQTIHRRRDEIDTHGDTAPLFFHFPIHREWVTSGSGSPRDVPFRYVPSIAAVRLCRRNWVPRWEWPRWGFGRVWTRGLCRNGARNFVGISHTHRWFETKRAENECGITIDQRRSFSVKAWITWPSDRQAACFSKKLSPSLPACAADRNNKCITIIVEGEML